MDWFRDTLADDKVPDFARFNDELPRTDTGQVRRSDLSLGLARGTIGGKGGCDTHCEWLRRLPRPSSAIYRRGRGGEVSQQDR